MYLLFGQAIIIFNRVIIKVTTVCKIFWSLLSRSRVNVIIDITPFTFHSRITKEGKTIMMQIAIGKAENVTY